MPGFFLRDLECSYCGNSFTEMEGDLLIPIPRLCDDCLRHLWPLTEQALDEKSVPAEIQSLLEQLKQGKSIEDILSEREENRKAAQ